MINQMLTSTILLFGLSTADISKSNEIEIQKNTENFVPAMRYEYEKNVIKIGLDSNYSLLATLQENDYDLITFSKLKMFFGSKEIFSDTVNEYDFSLPYYPKQRVLKDGEREILLLVNNRPNDNYLNRFLIRDGKILKDDILPELFPVFVNTSTQLITQMRLESRTTSEAVCMKCDSASYNPTLYFMVDKDQIKLDSVTTIRENEKYWGKFYGYKQDESLILVPIPNRHK